MFLIKPWEKQPEKETLQFQFTEKLSKIAALATESKIFAVSKVS